MTFKPMTYLVSFTLFVLLFMALGAYVGYGRITDHLLAQSFLDATPLPVQVLADAKGPLLRWEDRVALPQGGAVTLAASNRALPIALRFADEAMARELPLAAHERTEDLRLDAACRYLYARVFAASDLKDKETTWLCKYDLQRRRLVRRTSVNPILLPAPFRP